MPLGSIKQGQRDIFGLLIGFDLVHLLGVSLKVGPVFGDLVVPQVRVVYLNPLQDGHVRNIHLQVKGVEASITTNIPVEIKAEHIWFKLERISI